MKSIIGTARTPWGFCKFSYIDDNDLFQFIKESHSVDSEGLKDISSVQIDSSDTQITKEQTIEKLHTEILNNQQLKTFLSRMPLEEQRKFVQNILDSIMGLYK